MRTKEELLAHAEARIVNKYNASFPDSFEMGSSMAGWCENEGCRISARHPAPKMRRPTRRNGRASSITSGMPRCVGVYLEISPECECSRDVSR